MSTYWWNFASTRYGEKNSDVTWINLMLSFIDSGRTTASTKAAIACWSTVLHGTSHPSCQVSAQQAGYSSRFKTRKSLPSNWSYGQGRWLWSGSQAWQCRREEKVGLARWRLPSPRGEVITYFCGVVRFVAPRIISPLKYWKARAATALKSIYGRWVW